MDSILRKALEDRGLSQSASERDAQDFYGHLSTNERAKLGVELAQQVGSHAVEPLSVRNDPASIQQRDITTRAFQVRAQTVNEEERSVEAVISTDAPVEVWDWRRGETIDEVLLATAAQLPSQMPMLANHARWSLDSVLGSIRGIRVDGGSIIGRLMFARDDADADKAWNKVRQSHIVDVSVGYRVNEATEIAPGQTATIAGRTFTAGKRTLRVATNWTPKEGSLVPIGADQAAKIREDSTTIHHYKGDSNVNPKLRAFLETLGLRKESTDAEAQAYYDALPQADKARADAAAKDQQAVPPAEAGRSALPANPAPAGQPVDVDAAVRRALEAERAANQARVRSIRELAGDDVPTEVVNRAIDENWDTARASQEFLTAVRASRTPGVGPAIHSHSREADTNSRSLAVAMLRTYGGVDGDRIIGSPVTNGRGSVERCDRLVEADFDAGRRLGSLSATDLVRMCAQADTGRFIMDPEEAMRAALSGGTLAYVFTTSVYAKLIEGWDSVSDTTSWCDVEDVPNFMEQEDISLTANSALEQLPRGGKANDATMSDSVEKYKIARYAKKLTIDEMDSIDDRLGAIMRMPFQMGEAARRLRPDLVYSILLENANLNDGGALFNATAVATAGGHANLGTKVLGSAGLKEGINAMGSQRKGDVVLNIKPKFLIVPQALAQTGKEVLTSQALAKTGGGNATTYETYMPINVLSGEGITLVIDDRVGAIGVRDPRTKAMRTGLDTNWFLSAGGPQTVRVAYRRGTGRAPQVRSFVLNQGQWGFGWDINLDIGGKALSFPGMYKSTGAG